MRASIIIMNRTLLISLIGGAVGIAGISLVVWFLFFTPRLTPVVQTQTSDNNFRATNTQTTGVSQSDSSQTTNQVTPLAGGSSQQLVFKIADGPVSGATFTQTSNPTTTLARYVLQENGHVMDQPIDVPGSLPRAVSNTTIPGTASVVWANGGSAAYMQYEDSGAVKTVSLIFPPAATSSASVSHPVTIQFLPDNAHSVAVSRAGNQVAYLLTTSAGTDGYTANIDGSNTKKLFSVGLKELLISWPSVNTLLLSTKSAAGVEGAAFSVDARSGNVSPLLYASGLSATADPSFSYLLYRAEGAGISSYLHSVKQNADATLSFNPIPEKCAWGNTATTTLYCGSPLSAVSASYLDQWHAGLASAADAIISFVPSLNAQTNVIAVPGSSDGGAQSDILEMSVSPDDHYLLFITKGDRSLWGVRLEQQ